MNKTSATFLMAALAILTLTACGPRKSGSRPEAEEAPVETYFTAIDRYLADSLGARYASGEICVPFHSYSAVDETDADDIKVWGDFWVMNYSVSGDTLKMVSGGSHPGLMHVRQHPDGHFEVTSFDGVGDGSEYLPSARRIFGERFDAFQAAYSNEKAREKARAEGLARYVHDNALSVTCYQDYGWPAVELPPYEK